MFNRYKHLFARRIGVACFAVITTSCTLGAAADEKQLANGGKPANASSGIGGGGLGGGGFGFGGGGGISVGSVFLAASKSGKTLYGYSVRTGTWDKVHLDNPTKAFEPVLAGNEGCVVAGKRVYAFSGIVGRWDSIEVADSKEPPLPNLQSDDLIRLDIGSKIYMFSAITGRWAAADLSDDAD
jgi:hypothetical protein